MCVSVCLSVHPSVCVCMYVCACVYALFVCVLAFMHASAHTHTEIYHVLMNTCYRKHSHSKVIPVSRIMGG